MSSSTAMRVMALILLGSTVAASAQTTQQPLAAKPWKNPDGPTVSERLQQQRVQQQQQTDRIVELAKPLVACVKKNAHAYELYSSPESADVAAIAAVGLCSKQESAYRAAIFQLAILMPSLDAGEAAQRNHQKLVEMAITIIVGERQRRRAPSSQPPAPPRPSNRAI